MASHAPVPLQTGAQAGKRCCRAGVSLMPHTQAAGVETRQDSGPLHVNKQVKSLRSQSVKTSGSCTESHSHPALLSLKLGALPPEPPGSHTYPAH